jgi:F0F1-type ATP synthase membrane subunit a
MAPLLVFIELVSYSFRVVSLSLRLFANMMSGHCLLAMPNGMTNPAALAPPPPVSASASGHRQTIGKGVPGER